MLIDGYDQYTQQDADVVDITPDDAEDGEEVALRADDCMSCSFGTITDIY